MDKFFSSGQGCLHPPVDIEELRMDAEQMEESVRERVNILADWLACQQALAIEYCNARNMNMDRNYKTTYKRTMPDDKKKEIQAARDVYNITVNGDYQNLPEVKSITYSNTYNHYHGDMSAAPAPDDELGTFVIFRALYDKVVSIAHKCKTPTDILEKLVPVLRNACNLSAETIRGQNFRRAIIKHLVNYEGLTDNNLRQILKRVC